MSDEIISPFGEPSRSCRVSQKSRVPDRRELSIYVCSLPPHPALFSGSSAHKSWRLNPLSPFPPLTSQRRNLSARSSPSSTSPSHPQHFDSMSFLTRQMTSRVPTLSSRAFSTSRPSQLARLTLVGRLGVDPELIETSKGTQIIRYVIGTSHGPKDNRQTSWFRVASFAEGPQRDYLMGLSKG